MSEALERIRDATRGTVYEGRLFLVGGVLRDRALGLPESDDVDLVLEGDALALAWFLSDADLSGHRPVEYPRFGTAMLTVAGRQVELVSARAESYDPHSRKPHVRSASLREDAFRRDFTINTLMENLHTGDRLDLTGMALADLHDGLIRTPLEPAVTFHDDPLRMMRAVRFAVRFGFRIEEQTRDAVCREASRLRLVGTDAPVVSAERIRDEFVKVLMGRAPAEGLQLLLQTGLLEQFAPELVAMVGVTQNAWHAHDVWDHTLLALRCLSETSALPVRLGVLLHDVGKPATRSEDAKGVHFYEHQFVGADIARRVLHRLRFTNDVIDEVCELVRLHMRLGEAQPDWSEAAIRRLMRDTAEHRGALFDIARCDAAAMRSDAPVTDLDALAGRMADVDRRADIARLRSPLDGNEIMVELGISPGRLLGQAKDYLTGEVVEGRLEPADKDGARAAVRAWFQSHRGTDGPQ